MNIIIEEHIGKTAEQLLHQVLLEIHLLNKKIDRIMSTQDELAQQLTDQGTKIDALTAQVTKIGTEEKGLQDLVATLNGELANQTSVSPALQAAADAITAKTAALSAAIKGVDDQVADPATTTA